MSGWQTLVPDPLHAFCTEATATARKAADGSQAAIYVPSNISFDVVIGQMAGPLVRARWFDPTLGTYADDAAGLLAASGTHTYGAHGLHAGGTGDWLLRLDSVSALWPNQPSGFTSFIDQDFTAMPIGGWDRTGGPNVITDATAPLSPTDKVLDWLYPRDFGAGSSPGLLYHASPSVSEYFIGLYFKFSSPFDNQATGTKMWYPYDSGADYFFLFSGSGESKIWCYVQSPGYGPSGGVYNLPGNASNPTITLGQWYKFEHHFKPATSGANGIIKWWIDGVLCGNYTDRLWPSGFSWDEWRYAPVWGGTGGPNVAFDCHQYVDHIYMSKP